MNARHDCPECRCHLDEPDELSAVRAQLEAAVLDAKKWEIAAKYSGQLHEQLAERSMALADERDAAVRERDEARLVLAAARDDDDLWKVAADEWVRQRAALVAERDALVDLRNKARELPTDYLLGLAADAVFVQTESKRRIFWQSVLDEVKAFDAAVAAVGIARGE